MIEGFKRAWTSVSRSLQVNAPLENSRVGAERSSLDDSTFDITAAAPVIPEKSVANLAARGAPIDVRRPFNAAREAHQIEAALRGETNAWSGVQTLADSTWRQPFSDALRSATNAFSPAHAEDLYVRAYASILDARAAQSPAVKDYLSQLKPKEERGLIAHGYVGDFAVPQGKDAATFVNQKEFLSVLQGRAPAKTVLGRAGQSLREEFAKIPWLNRALRDRGLGFNRVMLTPFHAEDGLDGGYSQINPLEVDARYGGNAAHADYMREAVSRNIEAIADRIGNHNSREHERTQALLAGDLSRLDEHVNWSGAVKVGELTKDGQQFNLIVHTGEGAGAVSDYWAIFPDSNPDSVVRVQVPVVGKYRDAAELKKAVGSAFAMDEEGKAQVRAIYAKYGLPERGADGLRTLPAAAKTELIAAREANNFRTLLRVEAALARGEDPHLELDLAMSFMGNIQFDKNLAHPAVVQEELDAHAAAAILGQTGLREDAIIHAFKIPGTDQLNLPQVQAYMRYMNLVTEQMMPGRVLIPEAFLPPDVIRRDWLEPHLSVNGQTHSLMGDMAISFKSAMANTHSLLTGDATAFLDYAESAKPKPGARGGGFAYPVRLHDEALLTPELLEKMKAEGKIADPFIPVDAYLKGCEGRGIAPDEKTVFALLRTELESGRLALFANRAAGNDGSALLGTPERIAQSIALGAAGPDTLALYYRLMVGAGDNVDFALGQMKMRLEQQVAAGEAPNYRKAFDGRDLGRGPVSRSLWEQRIKERYQPLEVTRALNQLDKTHATVRSKDYTILRNADPAIATFARKGVDGPKHSLLQVFNVSPEARTVRISKADVAKALGWTDFSTASFKDILASRITGRTTRVNVRDAGEHLELELPANGYVYLEKRGSPAAFSRL